MNYKVIFTSLLILSFSCFKAQASCPQGNPKSTDYIRRQTPSRCEGIKPEPISGNSLKFISIATRNITSFGNNLTLQVPQLKGGNKPVVTIKSLGNNYLYQLDDLSFSQNRERFIFSWSTDVLKKLNIPASSLRAAAFYNLDDQPVYIPVILGQTSGQYEFVFYSENRVRFTTFQIISKGKNKSSVYRASSPNPRDGEPIFTWDGRKSPAGRYEIYYIAKIDQRNGPSERIERRITFEHNPNWLK